MRKLESDMLAAIKAGRNWQSGNTQITHQPNPSIYLHGNRIAFTCPEYDGLRCDTWVFKNWPTRTTVSRLRALGINACVCKGVPMIDGKPV
jgi:hypothetical protein